MEIKQIGLKNLAELQKISRITFADTFEQKIQMKI